jgi:hypothetical protein
MSFISSVVSDTVEKRRGAQGVVAEGAVNPFVSVKNSAAAAKAGIFIVNIIEL